MRMKGAAAIVGAALRAGPGLGSVCRTVPWEGMKVLLTPEQQSRWQAKILDSESRSMQARTAHYDCRIKNKSDMAVVQCCSRD